MADNKKFFWIKLKDTFMTSDAVDFLMGQKNGSQYVVLYQMLCLKTINTNGKLERQIGEIIIPYDTQKIARDCKYFDEDVVRVALELYKKLGLVYADNNGALTIANYTEMVGSESKWAEIKRKNRAEIGQSQNELLDTDWTMSNESPKNVHIEKEIRERERNGESVPTPPAQFFKKFGKYANVKLSEVEYEKLVAEPSGAEAIEYFSEYREMKGYKCKRDYLAICKWGFDAVREQREKSGKPTVAYEQKVKEQAEKFSKEKEFDRLMENEEFKRVELELRDLYLANAKQPTKETGFKIRELETRKATIKKQLNLKGESL